MNKRNVHLLILLISLHSPATPQTRRIASAPLRSNSLNSLPPPRARYRLPDVDFRGWSTIKLLRIKVSGHSPGSLYLHNTPRATSERARQPPPGSQNHRSGPRQCPAHPPPVQRVSCRQKPCIVNLVNHMQQRRKCNLPDNCSNCQNQAQRKLRDGVSRRRSLSRDGGRYDGDEQPAHECCNRVQSDGVHRYMFRC
jgi:hypothetical protein